MFRGNGPGGGDDLFEPGILCWFLIPEKLGGRDAERFGQRGESFEGGKLLATFEHAHVVWADRDRFCEARLAPADRFAACPEAGPQSGVDSFVHSAEESPFAAPLRPSGGR